MKAIKAWAWDVFLRSSKTASQAAAALLGGNAIGITDLNWLHIADVAGLAFVACVLHNLSNLKVPDDAAPVAPAVVIDKIERI